MDIGIKGYCVVFSDPRRPVLDLTGEFFDASTDFHLDLQHGELPVFYDHGFNAKVGKQRIGRATISQDTVGIKVDGTLQVPAKFGAMLKRLIIKGAMGYSTGAIGHMVEKEPHKGATRIKTWICGEISCTSSPAEPRSSVELKSADLKQAFREAKLAHYKLMTEIQAYELGIDLEAETRKEQTQALYIRYLRQKHEWQRQQLGL